VVPELAALGLPADLLPGDDVLRCLDTLRATDDAAAYVQLALTSALQRLPEAPDLPTRPGDVLVVVGDLDRAMEFALGVAADGGIDEDDVIVASEARHRRGVGTRSLISSIDDAAQLAARCRRSPQPTIVAMHSTISAEPDRWAARMLEALAPSAVWGVTAATHKAEDVAAWATGLHGLDALCVEDVDATVSPAQALAIGVPIACLDGRKATPALWATVLAGRLMLGAMVHATHAAQEA
jgi:hypothetical protein